MFIVSFLSLCSLFQLQALIVFQLYIFQLSGPKDFPRVSRIAGRMAGRAIGYVQLARGQFDVIMHQSQAQQVPPPSPLPSLLYPP